MTVLDVSHDPAERQRAFVERVQGRGELDLIPSFVAPDFVDHSAPPGVPGGPDGVLAVLGAIRAALPDHDARIEHLLADGDLVATHKTFTGTHSGELFGIPPSGRRATIRVMDVVRYREGMIVEHWNVVDVTDLAR